MSERAVVVKLDRGFPLAETATGELCRCKHATALVKGEKVRAAVGDEVELALPEGNDKALIERILPRRNVLVRKDPAERSQSQVLAANFDAICVVHPLAEVNLRRLERELVLAYETGARVAVVLTKADLAEDESQVAAVREQVQSLVADAPVLVVAEDDPDAVEHVRALVPAGQVAVLIGRSGVGKSSLINMLVGSDVQQTAAVRSGDGKGRHTTVSRQMVSIPGGGRVVDMPGVRGLGMWEAEEGIGVAFADIEELAAGCRFRDCRHVNEPGCAVLAAVASGAVSEQRLESYRRLRDENEYHAKKKRQKNWR